MNPTRKQASPILKMYFLNTDPRFTFTIYEMRLPWRIFCSKTCIGFLFKYNTHRRREWKKKTYLLMIIIFHPILIKSIPFSFRQDISQIKSYILTSSGKVSLSTLILQKWLNVCLMVTAGKVRDCTFTLGFFVAFDLWKKLYKWK